MAALQPSLFHQLPSDSVGTIFSFLSLEDAYRTALANRSTLASTKLPIVRTVSHLRVPRTLPQEKLNKILKGLPNLTSLHFKKNSCLENFVPLRNCPKLRSLYLHQVVIEASQGVDITNNCPQINSITLISQPNLVRSFFSQLPSRLERVELLDGNNITNDDIATLTTCRSLRLGFLPAITIAALTQLRGLSSLKLRQMNSISGRVLSQLTTCQNLSSLELRDMPQVYGSNLSFLGQFSHLTKLSFNQMSNVSGSDLNCLTNCNQLSDLKLQTMSEVFGLHLRFLEGLPKLRALTLNFVLGALDKDEFSVLGKCSKLQALKLRGLTYISGPALDCLNQCPELWSLTLSKMKIYFSDLSYLPLSQLKSLTLEQLPCDAGEVKALLKTFPQLKADLQQL